MSRNRPSPGVTAPTVELDEGRIRVVVDVGDEHRAATLVPGAVRQPVRALDVAQVPRPRAATAAPGVDRPRADRGRGARCCSRVRLSIRRRRRSGVVSLRWTAAVTQPTTSTSVDASQRSSTSVLDVGPGGDPRPPGRRTPGRSWRKRQRRVCARDTSARAGRGRRRPRVGRRRARPARAAARPADPGAVTAEQRPGPDRRVEAPTERPAAGSSPKVTSSRVPSARQRASTRRLSPAIRACSVLRTPPWCTASRSSTGGRA